MNSQPLVTVVTPSYNQAAFLEETILSVLNQDYPNIEYMIFDGGSTDGSVDIIKKYEDRLTYWVSEPDRGQSHAINKGWERARGEIIAYLNSDDLYMPGAVTAAVKALNSTPNAAMVYSNSVFIDEHGARIRDWVVEAFSVERMIIHENLVPQPTVFIRKTALDSVGLLDEGLHMVMDYDLWIRLGLRYPAVVLPDAYLAMMREHDAAKSIAAFGTFPVERRKTLNKLFTRNDLPDNIRLLRRKAFGNLLFIQAGTAAHLKRPAEIWSPLIHSIVQDPHLLQRRPWDCLYLLMKALMPWWHGRKRHDSK